MPMLSDPDQKLDQEFSTLSQLPKSLKLPFLREQISNDSLDTEFCDGPVDETASLHISSNVDNPEPLNFSEPISRQDLIQRLKRSQSPSWQRNSKVSTNSHFSSLAMLAFYKSGKLWKRVADFWKMERNLQCCHSKTDPGFLRQSSENYTSTNDHAKLDGLFDALPARSPSFQKSFRNDGALLPAFELEQDVAERMDIDEAPKSNADIGREIERPRSALHAGDFTQEAPRSNEFPHAFHEDLQRIERSSKSSHLGSSPTTPWYRPLPSPHPESYVGQKSPSIDIPKSPHSDRRPTRNRAPSLQSYSSSFILKPPTSPLVQQSNNEDLDFSPIDISSSPSKFNRRHTLPPHGFQSMKYPVQPLTLAQAARQPPSLQREPSLPFQAHQPRRSYGGGSSFPSSPSPQTPNFLRSRRPSYASEASPISASMVGSYEESILRGRMSATPSKPLDFTAQIGALGRGDFKPKMPAHVTIDFPAVYYSWQSGSGGSTFDEPAPYVGIIDIEHKLTPPQPKERRRRRKEKRLLDVEDPSGEAPSRQRESRREEKRKRRSPSPLIRTPLGGCYQIPQAGQLQILIKNPHKTAVKLFLVPYDLEGMQPGTKTFVRQRCFSAGPIIEKPLTSQPLLDSKLESKVFQDTKTKRTLRYLIQLNICSPSKGKFYLYKHMHVVFANRVPDNKEKLQSENIWPEPRYSLYKPSTSAESITASAASKASMEGTLRRRSYGGPSLDGQAMDAFDGIPSLPKTESRSAGRETFPPVPLIPPGIRRDGALAIKQHTRQIPMENSELSLALRGQLSEGSDAYTKLNKGDIGYGGVFGRPGTPEPGEGLLARRLKGLDGELSPKDASL